MTLPYIDGDTVHRICGYPELVDALARYHHERIDAMEDLILPPSRDGGEDQFFMRAAWQRDSILGVKVIKPAFPPIRIARNRCPRRRRSTCSSTALTAGRWWRLTAPS